jgi:hypothetical protein
MRKHRLTEPRFLIVSPRTVALLVFLWLLPGVVTVATGQGKADNATRVAQQQQTRFLYFGLEAVATYEIRTNESTFEEIASPDGSVDFSDAASQGETIILTRTGVADVYPGNPTGFDATDAGATCAQFSWDTPASSEFVSDYRVYWGATSGVYTDSSSFDVLRVVEQSGTSYYTLCGFPEGAYYFVLRAHNQFSHWSGLSNEASATIAGGQTQPPLPPTNVAASETAPGCATVTWDASGSPGITGYTVYWGTQSSTYIDNVEVSGTTEREVCGFTQGRWYFAVKTRTAGDESVFSPEFALDIVGPDTTPPVFSEFIPVDDATGVARNTQVYFEVADAGAGVDRNTIDITINGVSVPFTTLGSTAHYLVVTGPASTLPANTSIAVAVTASDLADPSNEGSVTWDFVTGDDVTDDTVAPVFSGLAPANGAENADASKPVRVTITDAGLGIDLASIELFINNSSVAFSLTGDIYSATISYTGGLSEGTTVNVRVEVCDLASPANCAVLDDYSFTVAGASFVSLPDGAIVPDGFWANEPDRPLEIRNLPSNWSVRIFDTAGTSVRRYRNDNADGETWLWDFNNDHGRRVARAIYLVRVSDGNGAIQSSGRFLVQIDP